MDTVSIGSDSENRVSQSSVGLGQLDITGNLALGILQSVSNRRAGMTVTLDPTRACWYLDLERERRESRVEPKDFHSEISSPTECACRHVETGTRVRLQWRALEDDAVAATISVAMVRGGARLRRVGFRLPGYLRVAGPGERDTLVYPYVAGTRIEDPARELFRPASIRSAKWNDRFLSVREHGFDHEADGGVVDFVHDYSGRCSMSWMDYTGPRGGLYLAVHDPALEHGRLGVRARRGAPGLEMRVEKVFNRTVKEWSGDFVLALHGGDWRRGADIYRRWFKSAFPSIRRAPPHVRQGPGVVCHYDFKWQDGTITHRFVDLPVLMKEARTHGFNSLLVAGWNHGGFDNNYPEFRPDPDLGGEDDLRRAVQTVHDMGGKVYFYVNAFSFDVAHRDYAAFGRGAAIKDARGAAFSMRWGRRELAGMCNSVAAWHRHVKDNVRYVLSTLGADGVYLDQLAVRPQMCYDPNHAHRASWVANNVNLLREMRRELADEGLGDAVLFSEFITDALATQLDFQLCHTSWIAGVRYAFPEMFRYTFPEATLIDQVLQKPWAGDPPEVEEDHFREVVSRQFIAGVQYWVFDHILMNPRIWEFFDRVVALRRKGQRYFADGDFLDTPAVSGRPPHERIAVKAYRLEGCSVMFAVWNRPGLPGEFRLGTPLEGRLTVCALDDSETSEEDVRHHETICYPASPLSLISIAG